MIQASYTRALDKKVKLARHSRHGRDRGADSLRRAGRDDGQLRDHPSPRPGEVRRPMRKPPASPARSCPTCRSRSRPSFRRTLPQGRLQPDPTRHARPRRATGPCGSPSSSTGFLYYVSVTGITGERTELPPDLVDNVAWLRAQTQLPICIGFGISTPEHVKLLAPVADGLIVGSAMVRRVAAAATEPRDKVLKDVGAYVASLLAALN